MLTVVVLGGSGFMGKHLLHMLREQGISTTFYLNRGRSYWGVEQPHHCAVHIPMDRDETDSVFKAFKDVAFLLKGRPFSIVDFSCDDEIHMDRVWDGMAGAGLIPSRYILISTDSVYSGVPLCERASEGISESHICVPLERKGYSGEKLRGERAFLLRIYEMSSALKPIYHYILRLPDVIGPYDNTGRFWATLLWAQSDAPLLLTSASASEKVSLVYGPDVANLCARLALAAEEPPSSGIYNVAFKEVITVAEIVNAVSSFTGAQPAKIVGSLACDASSSDSEEDLSTVSCDYYPSVSCGPLCIRAAEQTLGWTPLTIWEGLRLSVEFFKEQREDSSFYEKAFAKLPLFVKATLSSK